MGGGLLLTLCYYGLLDKFCITRKLASTFIRAAFLPHLFSTSSCPRQCHVSSVPVFNSMKRPELKPWGAVVTAAMIIALFVYTGTGRESDLVRCISCSCSLWPGKENGALDFSAPAETPGSYFCIGGEWLIARAVVFPPVSWWMLLFSIFHQESVVFSPLVLA